MPFRNPEWIDDVVKFAVGCLSAFAGIVSYMLMRIQKGFAYKFLPAMAFAIAVSVMTTFVCLGIAEYLNLGRFVYGGLCSILTLVIVSVLNKTIEQPDFIIKQIQNFLWKRRP